MKQLPANGLEPAEYKRREWRVSVPYDTTVEEMLTPEYWGHVSTRMQSGDTIEAIAEDNSFYAKFLVRGARKLEASVSLIHFVTLEAPVVDQAFIDGYEVKFRGTRSKWSILRGKDVIKDGFDTENVAKAYLQDYVKQIAA